MFSLKDRGKGKREKREKRRGRGGRGSDMMGDDDDFAFLGGGSGLSLFSLSYLRSPHIISVNVFLHVYLGMSLHELHEKRVVHKDFFNCNSFVASSSRVCVLLCLLTHCSFQLLATNSTTRTCPKVSW
jgi:hypothetical protein